MRKVVQIHQIDGFPKYEIRRYVDGSFEVISFHKVASGKALSPGKVTDERFWDDMMFSLYDNGRREEYTVARLRAIMARQILKGLAKEMNTNKFSPGAVQTGYWIVGSVNKATGVFSTSDKPAQHLSAFAAKNEAARLAAIDKSKKFVVLKVEAIASANDISWE